MHLFIHCPKNVRMSCSCHLFLLKTMSIKYIFLVDIWKRNRKYYAKSFSQPLLNTFVQYFYKKSCILLEVLKDAHNKDIFEIFERYTFDSFCGTLLWFFFCCYKIKILFYSAESIIGIDYDLQLNPKVKLVECISE